jgi:UDP-N-acetylglucosamine 2-epimerase
MNNLAREGITSGVHVVGDVMRSALEMAAAQSKQRLALLDRCEVAPGSYLLATVHRQENTDSTRRLAAIIDGLTRLQHPIVFPLHPRTRKLLAAGGIDIETAIDADGVIGKLGQIRFIEPVGYLDMVMLQGAARIVLTDSGGVQKEAYWLQRPCITLRDRTEWIETVESGWNRLVGADADAIVAAVGDVLGEAVPADHPPLYGDADAAERIAALI